MRSDQEKAALNGLTGPFAKFLNIQVDEVREGWAELSMRIEEKHTHHRGAVQGGLVVTLADAALAIALKTVIEPTDETATVEIKLNFIRPGLGSKLKSQASLRHKGKRFLVGDMTVLDDNDKVVAIGMGTFVVLDANRPPS
ncbi:MAG: hypothetical protein CL896_04170 [Dehalococcoidia bacterium]|nr:hypothetical protein [Dehalococcoidia bacterium]|tara:strand:+ start:289 stop:711 length:423 start_codon:yes stop_codon:yes gene_type:complete